MEEYTVKTFDPIYEGLPLQEIVVRDALTDHWFAHDKKYQFAGMYRWVHNAEIVYDKHGYGCMTNVHPLVEYQLGEEYSKLPKGYGRVYR